MQMNRIGALVAAFSVFTFAVAQDETPATPPPPLPAALVPAIDDAPMKAHSYDWSARHLAVLERIKQGPVDLALVGDSITHGWEGGAHKDLWDRYYAPRNAINEGFGWDRTEHVLWRLLHGEFDHIRPRVAVVMIGTNNLWRDSVDDVAAGIAEVVHTIHRKSHRTKILLLGIFPRGHDAKTPDRLKIAAINEKIANLAKERYVTYLDIGDKFLEPDGTISDQTMPDFLHPNHRGYEIWSAAMEPTLARLMGDAQR